MIQPRNIQFHGLITYTGVLLNRDDSGLAKRMLLGGKMRTRISGQCIKRHWRMDQGKFSLMNITLDSYLTKEITERAIMTGAIEFTPNGEIPQDVQGKMIEAINVNLYGKEGNDPKKRQPILFGQAEIEYLTNKVAEVLLNNPDLDPKKVVEDINKIFSSKDGEQTFSLWRQQLPMPAGIIGAVNGRMITSDTDANIEGALSVIHAFTVHPEESEVDFFTAMEDFSQGNPGAGHLGVTEINSGIYYVYACMDVPTLVSNTTGMAPSRWLDTDRSIAAKACANIAGLMATVSPGAKKGLTAPFAYANAMIVEIGERQPRTLSSAFHVPARPELDHAKEKLLAALSECDERYGEHEARMMMGFETGDAPLEKLENITRWIEETVLRGETS